MRVERLFRPSTVVASVATMLFLLTIGVTRAQATTITFDLTTPNSAMSGFLGPYATVSITASGGNATFVVTALSRDGYDYRLGDGGSFAFNSTQTVSVNFLTLTYTDGSGATSFSNGGSGNTDDGFGYFSNSIDNFDGNGASVKSITFTTMGGAFADAEHVLVANSGGFEAAAHIFVQGPTCGGDSACVTGFVGDGITNSQPVVPEPSSLILLGSGLMGAATMVRMRRRSMRSKP
jgi:PEP-CTERM motif